ncbi:MAG: AI-2E family transporter [Pseudomonadota bacterium]
MNSPALEQKTFFFLLALVTVAFGWILWPFYGAVFWGAILALMFAPLNRWLLRKMPGRANLAALGTLSFCLVIVILPMAFITASLVQEGSVVYQRIQSGDINFGSYVQQIFAALPGWATGLLDRFGLNDVAALQQKLIAGLNQGGKTIATQALSIGQNTFEFMVSFGVMLYLLFFLVRDGAYIAKRVRHAIPLDSAHKRDLLGKFATVIRATVKGNVAVAAAQGTLGGLAFWGVGIHGPVLWGVLMAFLSLLPAIGAALVWGPVALYFLATGALWQAGVLVFVGVFVIGLVDNILRPLLVGKDTKLPDYLVLISTLGGMAIFGLNGFVIGPVVAAMFIAVWDIFATEKDEPPRSMPVTEDGALPRLPPHRAGLPPPVGARPYTPRMPDADAPGGDPGDAH